MILRNYWQHCCIENLRKFIEKLSLSKKIHFSPTPTGDRRGGSEGISRSHSSKAVLITASLWTRRFTTLKPLGNSSSARVISFGSPMSSTNCPPIRRSQKWMILLQVINFVVWRCTLKILHCSEAQHQPRGLNYCGITFKGGSKSSRRALDRQCPEHGNGRISYR